MNNNIIILETDYMLIQKTGKLECNLILSRNFPFPCVEEATGATIYLAHRLDSFGGSCHVARIAAQIHAVHLLDLASLFRASVLTAGDEFRLVKPGEYGRLACWHSGIPWRTALRYQRTASDRVYAILLRDVKQICKNIAEIDESTPVTNPYIFTAQATYQTA